MRSPIVLVLPQVPASHVTPVAITNIMYLYYNYYIYIYIHIIIIQSTNLWSNSFIFQDKGSLINLHSSQHLSAGKACASYGSLNSAPGMSAGVNITECTRLEPGSLFMVIIYCYQLWFYLKHYTFQLLPEIDKNRKYRNALEKLDKWQNPLFMEIVSSKKTSNVSHITDHHSLKWLCCFKIHFLATRIMNVIIVGYSQWISF